jgi:hypothetical protein
MFELGDLGDLGPLKPHGSRPEGPPDLRSRSLDPGYSSSIYHRDGDPPSFEYLAFEVVTNTTKSFTSMLVYIPI